MKNTRDREQRESAIRELETLVGHPLPGDYRDFLLHDDPGSYFNQMFPVAPPVACSDELPINLLFETHCKPDEFSTVQGHYEIFASRKKGDGVLPPGSIPIGDCVEDVYLFMFVTGPRTGEVWLKNFSYLDEGKEDTPEEGLQRVAGSFTEFLASLREDEGEDD